MLIGSVSQVAILHIGVLVLDESQNLVQNKNGRNLVACLTQLINNAGISICMVGTLECVPFFTQAQQLARRSLGLQYGNMEYGVEFRQLCETLFQYQYVENKTEINGGIIQWLYEHSQGNPSMVVGLVHDAQEIAILDGREVLNMETLNETYKIRMSLLHDYIRPKKRIQTAGTKVEPLVLGEVEEDIEEDVSIVDMVARAKQENLDIVRLLKEHIAVEDVRV